MRTLILLLICLVLPGCLASAEFQESEPAPAVDPSLSVCVVPSGDAYTCRTAGITWGPDFGHEVDVCQGCMSGEPCRVDLGYDHITGACR